MKYQITFLGASNLFGRVASSLLRHSPSVGKLKLYDDVGAVGPEVSTNESNCQVQWIKGKEQLTTALEGSDIIVIGDECKVVQENEKDSLLAAASKVVDYSFAIAHTVPKAMLVVAASPLNLMVPLIGHVLKDLGCYDGRKLLGMTSIDTLRANALYSNYVSQTNAILPVVGGVSPQTRVPIFSQAKPSFSIPEDDQHQMIEEIKSFDLTIHDQDEKTSAIERAYATVRLVHSVISGLLEEPYAAEMALAKTSLIPEVSYFSLPVDLGKSGIERTFGLPELSPLELEMMDYAVINLNSDLMKAHDLYSTFKPCSEMVKNITYSSASSNQVEGPVKNDAGKLVSGLNSPCHQAKKEKSLRRRGTANRKKASKNRPKLPILHCPAPDVVIDIQKAERFGRIERAHKKLVINQLLPPKKQSELPELCSTKASGNDLNLILDKTTNDFNPLFKINQYTDDTKTNNKTTTEDGSIPPSTVQKYVKPQVSCNENVDDMNSDKKDALESIDYANRWNDNNKLKKHDKKFFKNTINCKQSSMNEKNDAFRDSKTQMRLKSKREITKSQSENIITAKDILERKNIMAETSYKTASNTKREIKRIVAENKKNNEPKIVHTSKNSTSSLNNNDIKEINTIEEVNCETNLKNDRDIERGLGVEENEISGNNDVIKECSQGIETNSKNVKDNYRELIDCEENEVGNTKDIGIFSNTNVTKGNNETMDSKRESEECKSIEISNRKSTAIDINKDFIKKSDVQQPLSADKVSEEVNIVKEMIGQHKNDSVIINDVLEQENKRENVCEGNLKNEFESNTEEIGISEEKETTKMKALVTGENNKINCEGSVNISESSENYKTTVGKSRRFSAVSEQGDQLKETNAVKNINEPNKPIDSTKKEEKQINTNQVVIDNFSVFAEKSTEEIVPKGVHEDVVLVDINGLNASQNEEFSGEKLFRGQLPDQSNKIVEIDAMENLEEIERPSNETKKESHNLESRNNSYNKINLSLYNIDAQKQGNIIRKITKQNLRPSFKESKDNPKHEGKDNKETVEESGSIPLAKNIQAFNYQPKLAKVSKNITNIDDILQNFVKGSVPKRKTVPNSEHKKQEENIYKQDNVYISHGYSSKDKVGQPSVSNQVVDSTKTTMNVQTLSGKSSIDSQPLNDKRNDPKNDQTIMQPAIDSLVGQTKKLPLPILIKNAKTAEDNNFHKNLWLKNKMQSKLNESSPTKVNLDKVLEDKNVSVNSCDILESFTQKEIKKNNAANYKTDDLKPLTYTLQTKSKKDELSKRYTILKKGEICNMVKEDINANEIKAKLYNNVHVRFPTNKCNKNEIRSGNNPKNLPAELRFNKNKNISTVDPRKNNIPRSISERDMLVHLKQSNSNPLRLKNTSFLNLMVNSGSKGTPTLSDASDAIRIRGSHNASSIHESAKITDTEDRKLINQQLIKKAKHQLNMTKIKNCKKVCGDLNGKFPIVSDDTIVDKGVTKNTLPIESSENSIAQLKNKLQILKDKYKYKKNNKPKFNSYTVSEEKIEFCDGTKNKKIGIDTTHVNDKKKSNDRYILSIPVGKNKSEQKIGSDLAIKEGNKKDIILSSSENPLKEMPHNAVEKKSTESDSSILNDKTESSIGADLKNNKSEEINVVLANSENISSTQIEGKQPDCLLTQSVVTDSSSKASQPADKPIYLEKANVVHDEKLTTVEHSSSEIEEKLQVSPKNIEGKSTLRKETTKPSEELNAIDRAIKTLGYHNSQTNKKVLNSRSPMSKKHSFTTPHKKSIHSFLDSSVKETKKSFDNSNIYILRKLSQEKSALSKFKQMPKKKSIEPKALKIFGTQPSFKNMVKTKTEHKSPDENPVNHNCNKTLLSDVKLEFKEINKLLPKLSSAKSQLLAPNCEKKNIIRKKILPGLLHAVKPFKNLNVDSSKLKNNIYARWTPQSLKTNKDNIKTNLERVVDEQKERSQKDPFATGKISMTTNLFKEYMRKNRNHDFTNSTTDTDRSLIPLATASQQNIKEPRLALSALQAKSDHKKVIKNDVIFNHSKLNTNKTNRGDNIFLPDQSPTFPKTAVGEKVTGASQISTSNKPNLVPDKNTLKIQTPKTHSSNSVYKPYYSRKTQNSISYQKTNNNFNKFGNPRNMTVHGKHKDEETKKMHLLQAFKDQENTENKFEKLQKVFKKQLNSENSLVKYSTTFTKNLNAKKPTNIQQKKIHLLKAYSQESLNNDTLENKPVHLRPLSAPPEYHPSFPLTKPKNQEKEKKKNYSEPTLKKRWTQLLDIFQSVIKTEKKNWEKEVPAQQLLFTEGSSHANDSAGSVSDGGQRSNSQRNQSSAKRVHSYRKTQSFHSYKPSHGDS